MITAIVLIAELVIALWMFGVSIYDHIKLNQISRKLTC